MPLKFYVLLTFQDTWVVYHYKGYIDIYLLTNS